MAVEQQLRNKLEDLAGFLRRHDEFAISRTACWRALSRQDRDTLSQFLLSASSSGLFENSNVLWLERSTQPNGRLDFESDLVSGRELDTNSSREEPGLASSREPRLGSGRELDTNSTREEPGLASNDLVSDSESDLACDSESDLACDSESDLASDSGSDLASKSGNDFDPAPKPKPDPKPKSGSGRTKPGPKTFEMLTCIQPSALTKELIVLWNKQPDKFFISATSESLAGCDTLSSIHQRIVENESQKEVAVIRGRFLYHEFFTSAKVRGYHTGKVWNKNGAQELATALISEGARDGTVMLGTTIMDISRTPTFEDMVREEAEAFVERGLSYELWASKLGGMAYLTLLPTTVAEGRYSDRRYRGQIDAGVEHLKGLGIEEIAEKLGIAAKSASSNKRKASYEPLPSRKRTAPGLDEGLVGVHALPQNNAPPQSSEAHAECTQALDVFDWSYNVGGITQYADNSGGFIHTSSDVDALDNFDWRDLDWEACAQYADDIAAAKYNSNDKDPLDAFDWVHLHSTSTMAGASHIPQPTSALSTSGPMNVLTG